MLSVPKCQSDICLIERVIKGCCTLLSYHWKKSIMKTFLLKVCRAFIWQTGISPVKHQYQASSSMSYIAYIFCSLFSILYFSLLCAIMKWPANSKHHFTSIVQWVCDEENSELWTWNYPNCKTFRSIFLCCKHFIAVALWMKAALFQMHSQTVIIINVIMHLLSFQKHMALTETAL